MGVKMWFIYVCIKFVKMIVCLVFVFRIIFFGYDIFLMYLMCIFISNLIKWWRSCLNIGRNFFLCVLKREWIVLEILFSIYIFSLFYEMNIKIILY